MQPGRQDEPRLTAEDIFTPWEMIGQSRRDSLPHRALLMRTMAYFSVLIAGLSLLCGAVGLLAVPLATATWWMAYRDLNLIRRGDMDTEGFHATEKARSDARGAIALSLCGFFIWFLVAAALVSVFLRY